MTRHRPVTVTKGAPIAAADINAIAAAATAATAWPGGGDLTAFSPLGAASPVRRRPQPAPWRPATRADPHTWAIRYSPDHESYIVYIPDGAARIWLDVPDEITGAGDNIELVHTPFQPGEIVIALDPVPDKPGWYLFAGATGQVTATVKEGKITVGVGLADGGLTSATIAEISAAIDDAPARITQIARSPLEFLLDAADPDAPAINPEGTEDPNNDCDQHHHPGDTPHGGPSADDHPGDDDPNDHPGTGSTDADQTDADHPGANDCYTTQ